MGNLTEEQLEEYYTKYSNLKDQAQTYLYENYEVAEKDYSIDVLLNDEDYCKMQGKIQLLYEFLDLNDYFFKG